MPLPTVTVSLLRQIVCPTSVPCSSVLTFRSDSCLVRDGRSWWCFFLLLLLSSHRCECNLKNVMQCKLPFIDFLFRWVFLMEKDVVVGTDLLPPLLFPAPELRHIRFCSNIWSGNNALKPIPDSNFPNGGIMEEAYE